MKNDCDSETRPQITESRSRTPALLLATCLCFLWPGLASTQEASAQAVPENAHVKDYGTGWECNRGYRLSEHKKCMKVEVPENAFLSFGGNGWKCHRGYRKGPDFCAMIEIPEMLI